MSAISAFPESEIYMATNGNSSKPISVVFSLPDPDEPKASFHGEVGGTATWQSSSTNYPNFEVQFSGSNPSNDTPNAQFGGSSSNPVVLSLNKADTFHYRIKQIKADGTHKISGPHTMSIVPQGAFINCHACPPIGQST